MSTETQHDRLPHISQTPFSPFVGASWGCTWWSPIFSTLRREKCGCQVNIAGSSACWWARKDPHSKSTSILSCKHASARSCWGNYWRNLLASDSQNPSLATAAKLAIQIDRQLRPDKRVSTSLCTLAAQLTLNREHFHCNCERQTWTWSKEKLLHDGCCCMDLSTQLVDKLALELAVHQLTLASSHQATASSTGWPPWT